jgi:sugar phosphate permease
MQSSTRKKGLARWYVLSIICLLYMITYLDRVNISAAAPLISKEFHLSKISMGLIFAAYNWGYSGFQVPGAWLGDRFGPRKVLAGIVVYWSLMTSLTAKGWSFLSFFIIRLLFGCGEAGAFSTATRAMQLWYPREERGLAQGLSHSASRLGAAVAPPITVAIMVALGWRAAFYIFAVLGVLWSLLWYLTYRNLPEQHKWVSREELEYIRGTDENGQIKPANVKAKPVVPWGVLLRSPNMWAVMCAYIPYCYCLSFFLNWLPSYLVEYRHFTLLKMGLFASLPLFAGVIGDTAGGWATDYLLVKTGKTNFSRRAVAVTGFLGTGAFILPAAFTSNPYTALYCLTASLFFLECAIGPAWAVPMDVGGEYSGTVAGLMNMAGNFGSALSPAIFGLLVSWGSWVAPFIVTAVLLVIASGIWAFWLSPETSVVQKGTVAGVAASAAGQGC